MTHGAYECSDDEARPAETEEPGTGIGDPAGDEDKRVLGVHA